MTRTQGNRGRALGLAVAVAALAACTSVQGIEPTPTATATGTSDATPDSTGASASGDAGRPAPPATALACTTAPKALVDQAAQSLAAHPGPVVATAYVFAATTDTGDWYVLAMDRGHVHDDGTPVTEPGRDHSRTVALTNTARTTTNGSAMIPVSQSDGGKVSTTWDRVSWTGSTLAAGKRAAERAVTCLDAKS